MSFEVYLNCIQNGDKGFFPTALVEAAFDPFISSREGECWVVIYPDSPSTLDQTDLHLTLKDGDRSSCSGLMVSRPTSNPRLYEGLMHILQVTDSILFCIGDCPPLVGRADAIPHIASEIRETLGDPVIVRSGAEIVEWFERRESPSMP
jgi:hypothetical protein